MQTFVSEKETTLDREFRESPCIWISIETGGYPWRSIKHGYLKTDIYKTWILIHGYYGHSCTMSSHEYHCLDIKCGHPHLYGELKTDIQKSWISIRITVDFWKSMHGYGMDSRTRQSSPAADAVVRVTYLSVQY